MGPEMKTLILEPTDRSQWLPAKDTERAAVTVQLDSILNSAHFRTSKRYPRFLRFVVQQELAGRGNELKERSIGIEVFGRDITYDTNADPIVRVAAAEVRKRLAKYYADPNHSCELRIHLSSGSYIPNFQKPYEATPHGNESLGNTISDDAPPAKLDFEHSANDRNGERVSTSRRYNRYWLIGLAFLAVLGAAGLIRLNLKRKPASAPLVNALNAFWYPITEPHTVVLASMGTLSMLHPESSPSEGTPTMGVLEAVQHYNIVPLPDAITLSKISLVLGEQHASLRVINSDTTSFDDVQAGPTILIGAFSNQWTLRLTSKLRFYFQDSATISRIQDRKAKIQPEWLLHRDHAYSSLTQDYAVVARYRDSTTGRVTVIGAGIGPNGTLAVGDFLTHNEYLEQLFQGVPRKDWELTNVEAVISTQVINGKSGPPRVVAKEFWQ